MWHLLSANIIFMPPSVPLFALQACLWTGTCGNAACSNRCIVDGEILESDETDSILQTRMLEAQKCLIASELVHSVGAGAKRRLLVRQFNP
jgi:hypothetical protein